MFKKILNTALRHKFLAALIIIALGIGGYYGYNAFKGNTTQISYTTTAAQKGTIVVSVTGSGQVSASNQVDIQPKVSGDVVYIGVSEGQTVSAGTLLVQLDATNAQKAVRDAQANLESAQLNLEKLQGPQTSSSSIPRNKQTAQDNLKQAYDDGFNNVSSAFLDLPNIMTGLQNEVFGNDKNLGGINQQNIDYYANAAQNYDSRITQYRNDAYNKYQQALGYYNQNFTDYKSASRYSDQTTIDNLINETYNTTKSVADAIQSMANLIQFYKDTLISKNFTPNAAADTHLANLNTYTGQINNHIISLLNSQSTIKNDKNAVTNADLDMASQQLAITQSQNSLSDAQSQLAYYYIRAPFSGVVAKLNVQKSDSVGSGTTVATMITTQKMASISLNEVDVAKVKVGQKTTLTFDAVPDLSIAGQVAEIDAIGTVSQGVVTYNVKIVFDTQDQRVKSGMSVNAAIITDVKQNVIIVPNSAVKSENNTSYVQILVNSVPQNQTVETGLSNDTMTEITSGLQEGEQVITQTINTSATTQTQTSNTGFRIPGLGGGFGR